MSKPNPFAQTMVRMQLPPGMGASISARGFEVEADADHCVTVPKDVAEDLKAHGLTPYVETEKAAPAKK